MSQRKKQKTSVLNETITLNNGVIMPVLGIGTFLSKPGEVGEAVRHALKIGYKAVDCAYVYRNEDEIGKVFTEVFSNKSNNIKRKDIFITSKLACTRFHEARQCLEDTLKALQLKYLDLYLVHLPVCVEAYKVKGEQKFRLARGKNARSLEQVWRVLEQAVADGLVKSIGVSNYNAQALNDLLNYCKIKPVVNQIENHCYLPQNEFRAWMRVEGIHCTAYAPLGAPGLRDDPAHGKSYTQLLKHATIKKIADKHKKTPAQVLIRFQIDQGNTVIPKSVKPSRIEENCDVDFKLTASELKQLNSLDHVRYFEMTWFTSKDVNVPFPTFA